MNSPPPEPTDSGSFGTQDLGVSHVDTGTTLVTSDGPLMAAVKGLGAQGMRSPTTNSLMIGVCLQLKLDLDHSRSLINTQEQRVAILQTKLSESELKSAVLAQQCATLGSERKTSSFLTFIGTTLVGLSVTLFQANLPAYGWLTGFLGAAAIVVAWFIATKKISP